MKKLLILINLVLVLISCSNGTKNENGKNLTPLQKYENAVSKFKNKEVFNYKLLNDSLREIYDDEYRTKVSERKNEIRFIERRDSLKNLGEYMFQSWWDLMDEAGAIRDEVEEKYYPPILFKSYADFNPVKALVSTTWVYPTKENPIGEIKFRSDGSFVHTTDRGYPILATYPLPGSEERTRHPLYGGFQRETWGDWEVDAEGKITLTYSMENAKDWGWIYEKPDEYENFTPKEFSHVLEFDKVRHKDGYWTPNPLRLDNNELFDFSFSYSVAGYPFAFYESTEKKRYNPVFENLKGFWVVTEEENLYFPDWSGMVYNHFENLGKTIFLFNRNAKDYFTGTFMENSTGKRYAFGVRVNKSGDIIDVTVQ
jgi:hypothetical protein